jgi:hypothetical protein
LHVVEYTTPFLACLVKTASLGKPSLDMLFVS